MRVMALALSVGAMLGLAAQPASSRELTGSERAELALTVERFDAAVRANRADEIVGVLPPRILSHLASRSGVDVQVFRKAIVEKTSDVMKAAIVRSFAMKLASARYRNLADGTPYVLIPTELRMEVAGRNIQTASDTLAVKDNGNWYLLDLSEMSRVLVFTQVYPEFADAEFGGKTMKAAP